jgi:hypothetical protein
MSFIFLLHTSIPSLSQRSNRKEITINKNTSTSLVSSPQSQSDDSSNTSKFLSSDEDCVSPTYSHVFKRGRKQKLKLIHFEKLSEISDRYKISYRASAAIASATLEAVHFSRNVIDHTKLRKSKNQETFIRKAEIYLH